MLFLNCRLEKFSNVLKEQIKSREERQVQRVRMMNADPFDTETQRLIADEIRQKNIEANMEAAMEYNPETFGTVVMLYINCKVNGFPVKAFIDSGNYNHYQILLLFHNALFEGQVYSQICYFKL